MAHRCVADIRAFLKTLTSTTEKDPELLGCKEDINDREASVHPVRTDERQPIQHRLAYLDGLRGIAALLVYILHYQVLAHSESEKAALESGYGFDGKYYFGALPGVRIFFTGGHFAVTTFFVISGMKLLNTISSALFRRWFRLFIPCAVTTFIWMTSWHLFRYKTQHEQQPTYLGEVWSWYKDFTKYSWVFSSDYFSKYNFRLWSIPLEFRGSVLVYLSTLALHRVRNTSRLLCECGLIIYFLYVADGWYLALFMVGMLFADLDLSYQQGSLPEAFTRWRPKSKWAYVLLLSFSIYLDGVPSANDDIDWLGRQPGWYWLSFLKPGAMYDGRWLFRFLASTFVMIAIPRIKVLKRFFEASFCQYLGRVSYAFYLIHGNILFGLGDRLYAVSGRVKEHHMNVAPGWQNFLALPGSGPLGLEVNFLAPQLILLPLTLWCADIVTRAIDDPSVRFAQWLYRSTMTESQSQVNHKIAQSV